jgi:hypothetical protein
MEFQQNSVKPPNSESWDVLQEEESRSALASEPVDFRYKSASLAVQARSKSCNADVLARLREASENDINGASNNLLSQGGNVVPNGGGINFT